MNKILALHPDPNKTGTNISLDKYEIIKKVFLDILDKKRLTHNEIFKEFMFRLEGKFDGSVGWYMETVKLDLEARKIIARSNDRPQKYYLT
ncbi:MAG: hypothetical protein AAGF07_01525 [Patescibacteria group bacterium]